MLLRLMDKGRVSLCVKVQVLYQRRGIRDMCFTKLNCPDPDGMCLMIFRRKASRRDCCCSLQKGCPLR